jgi:hypothetical protein
MHLHHCRFFQKHLRMLLQSLKDLCKAPERAGSIWKYLEALLRATRVSGKFACGFKTNLHFADVEVVRVEVVPVNTFAAVLANIRALPHCFLKQFSVVCPRRWQLKHFGKSFHFLSLLISLLSLLGLLPPLPVLPPLPPFFAKSRASGASPFTLWIVASFSTSLVTIPLGVAVIIAFWSILSSGKTFHLLFLGIPGRR